MKKTWEIDIPVALIFFNRPKEFEKVFNTVREAKPSRLFLIQDGAREDNVNDIINIQKCRDILKNIDWECDVNTDYSSTNLGCGRRIYTGLTKCFEEVDRLIILEDDCVPSQSFFPFCKELLEKYKNEKQIGMITGMNHFNTFDKVKSDYFFAKVGSIAGWATWKRMWDLVDYNMDYLAEEEVIRIFDNIDKYVPVWKGAYEKALKKKQILEKGGKLTSWSTQFGLSVMLNSPLIIVPKVNLMSNIGLSEESANSLKSIKLVPRRQRPLYRLKLFEMDFPLRHPKYIVDDYEYDELVNNFMNPPKFIALWNKIESIFLRIINGDFTSLKKGIYRRLKKHT